MQIIRGPIQSAQRVVIYGPEGIGKSTLASRFPDTLFIDTEGSTKQLDVARTPRPTSWPMLLNQVDYVKNNPSICKTLVIDTADWAENLCVDYLCAKYNKAGIEEFGYGKGYVYLGEEFGRLLNVLGDVIERGIHVVFTAHATMRKFEQPDEAGSYDRWELKLQKKTAPLLKEWADMLLFCTYKTYVVEIEGTKKAQGGKRVIYATHHPCWDAKNRHGLPAELPMEWSAIAHCFGQVSGPASTPPSTASAPAFAPQSERSAPAPETESRPAAFSPIDASNGGSGWIDQQAPKESQNQPNPPSVEEDLEAAGVPKALADLMREHGVKLDEIQEVVAKKGYFPRDTPFRNYPEDFVQGVLIAAWPQVLKAIEDTRIDAQLPF